MHNNSYTNEGKIRSWDKTKYIDSLHSIDPNKIGELNNRLENTPDQDKDNVNEVITNVKSFFENAAESTF